MAHSESDRQSRLRRYDRRIALAKEMLGGRCAVCGSTDGADFDHIDPRTKLFNISTGQGFAMDRFLAEVRKCQLLCEEHHAEKSAAERGMRVVKGRNVHGTISSYRYCKCPDCRAANAAASRRQKENRGLTKPVKATNV